MSVSVCAHTEVQEWCWGEAAEGAGAQVMVGAELDHRLVVGGTTCLIPRLQRAGYLILGVTNDKFPRCTLIEVIHKDFVFINRNIANNYRTNVTEVSFCCYKDSLL